MNRHSNVRTAGSPVAHAHARTYQMIARCGVRYGGVLYTEDPIDCMTCLVSDEWACADINEIIVSVYVAIRRLK